MIRTFFDILRFRSGPQELPAAPGLAFILVLAYLMQGLAADQALDPSDTAPRSLLAIGVQFGIIVLLLRLRNYSSRIPQTLSALAGTGFIIGLLSIVLLARIETETPQTGLVIAYFALFIWSLAVDGHIYRHALSTKMSFGVLVAVMIFAANFILLRAAFG